ncbi:MAG: TolC family protein [Calditrichaeota bacterium]|nr:MAG: TolC family protein [Calditrichota bacterium]MBL1204352.1 TolC family protein [Calditrichota bacterium]NOG44181.1 TolC family protein [Calditrichota bacterium]
MKTFRITIIIFSFFALPICAENLDINATLKRAKEQSKELKLARAELDVAQANINEAWASALPNISADVNYSRNLKEQFFIIKTGAIPATFDSNGSQTQAAQPAGVQKFTFSFKNQYSVTAKLEQTLYSFGKVSTALDIAYDFEEYAELNYKYQRQQILTNTRIAFYNVLLMKQIFQVAKDSEESSKGNFNEAKTKFNSGVASEYEMLQAEVRWQNSIPTRIAANKNYLQALNSLKSILNIPLSEELELTGSMDDLPPIPEKVGAENVLTTRSDYKAIQLEGQMRDKNVDIEFANHLPKLSGDFTYNYSGQSDDFKIENDFDNYVIGINLNIPLYSGGFTSAQVQKARIESFKTETRIAQAKDKIEIELDNVQLNLQEAHQRIIASKKNVVTARRTFEIAESRWDNGLATQLELKDSRLFLDQAKVNWLTAQFDYLKAYFNWQMVTGRWDEE